MARMKSFIKNKWVPTLIFLSVAFTSFGRTSIGQAFVDMPDAMVPLLDSVMRANLVDNAEAGSINQSVRNMAGDISTVDTITADYLKITISPVSTLELHALNHAKGCEAAFVASYTIGAPSTAGDSELMFFNSDMQRLPAKKYISMPAVGKFFKVPKGTDVSISDIESLVPFPTMIYHISPDSDDITATLTVGEYMTREAYAEISPYLSAPLRYDWNGKKYILTK